MAETDKTTAVASVQAKKGSNDNEDDNLLVKPIPILDASLTPIFFLECVYAAYFLYTRPDEHGKTRLVEVIVGIFLVMGMIFTVKRVARSVFKVIRNKYSREKNAAIPLKKKSLNKFSEQSWQLVVHIAMSMYSLYVMRPDVDNGGSWWRDTLNCWSGPGGELYTPANPALDRMYVIQLSVWIATAFSHEYLDEKHKDYYVMYLHHIVTIFLVSFSWGINVKFGFLVLFVHDVSDIGIDLLKMCNYCDFGADHLGIPVTESIFLTALVGWIYFRLYKFPTKLLRAAWFESGGGTLPDGTEYMGVCYDRWDDCWTLRLALVVLQVMHVYWTYLLLNILVSGFSKKSSRETYEGKSDTDEDSDLDTRPKEE